MTEQSTPKQEGVTKFQLEFTPAPPLPAAEIAQINTWRAKLYHQQLIGQDPGRYGGYGYGNLSMRLAPFDAPPALRRFVISGSQTGDLAELGPEQYAIVTECYPQENRVVAHGPIRPSSESLTHGAVYALDPVIRVVFHAHSPEIWRAATALRIPITDPLVPYGTPAMAAEVVRLFAETTVRQQRIFSMGGHEDGIVAFGETAEIAGAALLAALAAAQS
ncbi:MAG: class II aldolase/adducin family protein [Caldilineaceae bacterium]|nr:class II aldolase/adducin family protein [Caldilineaceae bacterium]